MEKNQNKITEEEVQIFNKENKSNGGDGKGKRDYFLPMSILVAAVLIAGAIIFAMMYKGGSVAPSDNGNGAAQNTGDIMKIVGRDTVLGDPNAPITIVEYGDYQCPYCNLFFMETQPLIVKNYVESGKVKMVFRNLIVNDRSATQHESHNAALAVECAKDQNKFWDFHDALSQLEFKDESANPQSSENNNNLNKDAFMNIAKNLGMDQGKFATCFDSGQYSSNIQAESDQALKYGINATPAFFINGKEVVGAQPYANFKAVIDALL